MSAIEVRLRRPSSDTAWGFRLQGGQDVSSPLTVQRVFNGSPADGNLQRGDVLLSINGTDVSSVYLKKAEELVKASSNSLLISVRRTGQPVNSSQPHVDLPTQQQPVYRKLDSSPSQALQSTHPVPSSFGSSQPHQPHQQSSGRPVTQSNIWRPPTQPSDSYNGHQSASTGEVKNQWQSSSSPHQAGDFAGGSGHHSWSDASAGAGSRPGLGSHQQTGHGVHVASVHDDHLFPPFSGSSNATPAQHHGVGTNQNYAKQSPVSPQSVSHGSQSSVEPHHPVHQQQQQVLTAEGDDDEYEVKSVRDIKQMFNQMAKPSSSSQTGQTGPKKAPTKPHVWQTTTPSHKQANANVSTNYDSSNWTSALSPSTKSISQSTPTAARSFASPPKASPSSNYYDDLYGSYPPPRQDSATSQPTRPVLSKAVTPQPKPGAGYSYQGIVTVTPAKTVQGKGKTSGGGSGQPNKKKEFDPSQSLVFQALQEENERAKRGEVASPEEEPPRARGQASGAYIGQQRSIGPVAMQHSQQPRSGRLQELLERDQAQAQQLEDQKYGATVSPQMSAQARREMSPSYPRHQQPHPQLQQQQRPQQQQYQQQQQQQHHRPGTSSTQHHEHHQPSAAGRQQSYHQQAQQPNQHQYQPSSASPAHGYHHQQQQQYGNAYHGGGYGNYGDANNHDIPISDF